MLAAAFRLQRHLRRAHVQLPVGRVAPVRPLSAAQYGMFDPSPDSDGASIGDVVLCDKTGVDLLHEPLFNRGSAFSLEERERLGLRGLVPPKLYARGQDALASQAQRVMRRLRSYRDPLNKYQFLASLQDRNETLFYRMLVDNLEELAPIVYTPTVGRACLEFSTVFRRPRGMYFSSYDRGHMQAMVFNWPADDVRIVCATDGSRVLGHGDLGCQGSSIVSQKLVLYTAAAGVHPSQTLPIMLDAGTNNVDLLEDPMYLGVQHPRLTGDKYDAFVDEFVNAVRERWPDALLHFEDFSGDNAMRLLRRYSDRIRCFNDDISGTGAVALSGVLNACRMKKQKLTEQRIVVLGAGSAGIGIAEAIRKAMTTEGLLDHEARARFALVDNLGSLGLGRRVTNPDQGDWVNQDLEDELPLLEVVKQFRPNMLIGVTGVPQLFTQEVVETMSEINEQPVIFPLSNPTDRAECTFEQAVEWSKGSVIFASGSPFQPLQYEGRTLTPGQLNNMYIFPAIGLGSTTCQPSHITPDLLYQCAKALAEEVPDSRIEAGHLFPPLNNIRHVSLDVAMHFCKEAQALGLASRKFKNDHDLEKALKHNMWEPKYGTLVNWTHRS